MNDFEFKSNDEKKQEVLKDWLKLTNRSEDSINIKEFLNHPALENLSVQDQELRLKIGKQLLRDSYRGVVLKLDVWLDAIYDFTISQNASHGVWISRGSRAYHKDRDCKWFQKGLNREASFYGRSLYKEEFISEKVALARFLRRCKSCY